jgi:hypothetical protein
MTVHATPAEETAGTQAQESAEQRAAGILLDAGVASADARACVPQWPHFAPIADAMERQGAERGLEAGE